MIVVCVYVLASFVYGHGYLGVDLFARGGGGKAGEGDGPHMSRNQRVVGPENVKEFNDGCVFHVSPMREKY